MSSFAVSTSTQTVWPVLINGTGNASSIPPWMQTGSPTFNAITSTYGVTPSQYHWAESNFLGVIFPYYSGITSGAFGLAGMISSLPAGEVNLIAHSHGGNVAILASFLAARPVHHMVNLATPINWDLQRYTGSGSVYSRCQVSSYDDWVQFIGASPDQVYGFADAAYDSAINAYYATNAFLNGDYQAAAYYSALATYYFIAGVEWFESTKIELQGPTWMGQGLSHGDLHEPPVWNFIAPYCAVN